MKWSFNMEHLCDKCGQILPNKASLLTHNRWKHKIPNSSHKCTGCHEIFATKYNLDRHQKDSGCDSSVNTAVVQGHPSARLETQITKSSSLNIYQCAKCGETFQHKSSILSHIKWKHENPTPDLKCSVCQKIFASKYSFDRHQKICHDIKINKVCCICRYRAPDRAEIIKHYEVNHNVNITKKTLNFNTFEEFIKWKEKFEKDTKSHFVKRNGTRRTKNGVNIFKYVCHRHGYFRSKGKGIRLMKKVGSNKINAHCPASITVSETDLNVKVVYIDTHIGHELDLNHLNISRSEKAEIAQRLAKKIPFEQILGEIRDSAASSEPDRIHLTTRKDLWNIAASCNINQVQGGSNNTPKEVIYLKMDDNVISEATGDEEGSKIICEPADIKEECVNICDAAGDEEESKVNISEAAGNKDKITILRVASKAKQLSFNKRKQDMVDKFLQACSTIKTEEQLEAVLEQVAPVDSIVNALSKKDVGPIPKASKESKKKIKPKSGIPRQRRKL